MKDIRIERGDIFYVNSFVPTVGCEQRPGRPGVIVSNDANNRASRTVEIVYCTTRDKPNLPAHTIIHSTAVESTVLCEQITTISIDCIGTYIGRCTAAEMEAIDKCLVESIGLTIPGKGGAAASRPASSERQASPKGKASRASRTKTYTIQAGDSLWGIARKNDVSVEDIKRWNDGVDAQNLRVGSTLIVGD